MPDEPTVDSYFEIMFPGPAPSGFIAWKRSTTGATIARRLWEARQIAVEALPPAGPDEHRVVALWHPDVWTKACADCGWLGYHGRFNVAHRTRPVLAVVWRPPFDRGPDTPAYTVQGWHGSHSRPRKRL